MALATHLDHTNIHLFQEALTGLIKILQLVNETQMQNAAGEFVSFPLAMLASHIRGKLYVPLFEKHRCIK